MNEPKETPLHETHPLEPFIPEGAKLLMLGSFPPPRERWCMDFYYPNLQNDMWRIFGLVFFDDREYFLTGDPSREGRKARKIFSKTKLEEFLSEKKIALTDTALTVIRHKGNASDKFLEITQTRDMEALFASIPQCRYIVTTGDKATQALASVTGGAEPPMGSFAEITFAGRMLRHYRMPSSSRAYPLAIEKKAAFYAAMMRETGIL